jgi:hypothetical protein
MLTNGLRTAIPTGESPLPAKPGKEYYALFLFLNEPDKIPP